MISKIFNLKLLYEDDEAVLLFWQKKIFMSLFIVIVFLGCIPYLLSCKYAFDSSEWHRIFFYTFIYLWCMGVAFIDKIPFSIRVWAGIAGFYLLGVFSMTYSGLMGSTRLYLLCFSAFAAIFLGLRAGLITLVINMATLAVFGYVFFNSLFSLDPNYWPKDPMHLVVLSGTFSFLCASIIIALSVLIKAVEISGNEQQQQLKDKLLQAKKFEALGILAGSVAHDLNNILSGIATYPEVLMMDDGLDPEIRKSLGIIKDSGQKASAIVSDLLTVARGASAEIETLNLNSIIERYSIAHDFKKISHTYPQVKIEITLEPELFNLKGSYIHIEKLIMNLVLNAVEEVCEQLDAKVCITTANNYIDPSLSGYEDVIQGEYVILRITDNGSGIKKHHIKNIFDPFFTKKEMGKSGTGLGLTVVWNAVQDHNGYIFVSSGLKGTTFEVLFPAVRQEISTKTVYDIGHGNCD